MGVSAIVSKGFADGGVGTKELATAVVNEIENGNNNFKQLYDWNASCKRKNSNYC